MVSYHSPWLVSACWKLIELLYIAQLMQRALILDGCLVMEWIEHTVLMCLLVVHMHRAKLEQENKKLLLWAY